MILESSQQIDSLFSMQTHPSSQLELTPHGVVICRHEEATHAAAFHQNEAAGLIALAGQKRPAEADGSVRFWHELGSQFLRAVCHLSEGAECIVPAPATEQLEKWVLNIPPMRGAEYLSTETLEALWKRLEQWTQHQVESCGGLAEFLQTHAPLWSRVGRITLHLAENKSDEQYPFAFMATYASGLTQSGRVKQLPLGKALKEYAGTNNKPMLLKLLQPLNTAAQQSELIAELIKTGDVFHPLVWLPQEAYAFLQEIPAYEDAGLLVRLPNWWKKRTRRPKVAVTIGEQQKSRVGINAMLSCRLEVVIDGQRLSRQELQELLDGEDGLVMLRGQWVEVDRAQLQQALAHWERIEAHGELSFAEGMRLLAGAPRNLSHSEEFEEHHEWSFVQSGEALCEMLAKLNNPEETPPPETLQATLRPYQQKGLNWLWFCATTGLGACLADDMGLGKTMQVLAALLRKKETDPQGAPALLIVPTSLMGNWKREAAQFAPALNLHLAHRSQDGVEPPPADCDLVVTTYGMLTRLEWPAETSWSWIILDEAQAIKNHATRQSRAVRALQAKARIALTGTPIENRLGDLWSLFDFLNPGLLGNASQFSDFTKAIQTSNHEHYAPLRRLVSPYILRRLKTDKSIISDLPDKTEMKVFCGLTKPQATLYQQSVQQLLKELKDTDSEGIQKKGLVLTYLMRFKQICNHPDQATGTGEYAPAHSAKFKRLETICSEIESRGEKVLIFTQFKEITEPLADCLAAVFGRSGLILHGGTPAKKRQEMVDAFQREDGPPFFVLSIKAGGTGLNLTAASHVIHFDRWWNPAIENQATDRAFRIGQKRNVLVHKFITTGTLEEKIDALLTDKQQLSDQLLTAGPEKTLTEMSSDELLNLVRLNLEKTEA